MIIVGIVGNEAAKFTSATEEQAREVIRILLKDPSAVLSSGHCHLGGIDIYAEEEYDKLPDRSQRPDPFIYPPKTLSWEGGYKPRNIQIAMKSHQLHNIVVEKYPEGYTGMRFNGCYHCKSTDHIKSGGCWTLNYAKKLGRPTMRHTIVA